MAEPNSTIRGPRDVNESNIAMDAIMKELMQRLSFGSKTLIYGQEDILTLSEYEVRISFLKCNILFCVLLTLNGTIRFCRFFPTE